MDDMVAKRESLQLSHEIGTTTCLFFHEEGEEARPTREVNLAVLPDVQSKDTSHAFFGLQSFFHTCMWLGLTDSRQGASSHYCNKNARSAGQRAMSFPSEDWTSLIQLYGKLCEAKIRNLSVPSNI